MQLKKKVNLSQQRKQMFIKFMQNTANFTTAQNPPFVYALEWQAVALI